jgi:uncharacterized protein (TIGR02421 family)
MPKSVSKSVLEGVIKDSNEVFRFCSKKLKILSVLSWGASTANEFFRKKESVVPTINYQIDRHGLTQMSETLRALSPKLKGDHPVLQWLARTQESYLLGANLLREVGTDSFHEISTQMYGNSKSKLFKGKISNLDLANKISSRISVCNVDDITKSSPSKTAREFATLIEAKLKERRPLMTVKVELSDEISAKVVAGMNRVRIRRTATFSEMEVAALWNHEIESHSLTANNGFLQEQCDFLCSGGPRTTMTQEGLAVFFEMYGHSLTQRRFMAICDRVHAVELAENGATFIDLYRWYKERTDTDMDAFFAASRIFRGAPLEGGKPFTKDVVYVGGLLGIFNFLQIAVKNQNRLLVESLIAGRIALEDVGVIAWLRTHGILTPPRYIPEWIQNWEALLTFFSFSAFLNSIDLLAYQEYFDTNTLQDWDLGV